MKKFAFNAALKPVLAAMLLAGACTAQAASLQYVDHFVMGSFDSSTDGNVYADYSTDLSSSGDVAVFGGNEWTAAVAGGSVTHGYAADGYFMGGNYLSMSFTQYLKADAVSALSIGSHSQTAMASMSSITLKILGDAGEANGSQVRVSFSGMADLIGSSIAGAGSSVQADFSVFNSSGTLVSLIAEPSSQNASQAVSFSFLANIGEEVTLSSTVWSNLYANNLNLAASGTPYDLASSSGQFAGTFSIAAVPEPESYAMFLAGLGLLGAIARRKHG